MAALALSGALAVMGVPSTILAAPPPAGAAPAPRGAVDAKPESGDAVERARVHYERGIQLFNEDNYDASLFEFERAFELAPSYKILYNMGRIQRQQNNYAAALRSYTRYLREGGAAVSAERRAEVEAELAVLKPRVAAVKVTVNIDGASIYADDIPVCTATIESTCVGKSPLQAPIVVNGGRHKITATMTGYAPATALVSVVGSDTLEVKLELVSYTQAAAAPRRVPWGGWAATGALAVGAGVFGYLTLSQSAKLDDARAQPNADADALDARASRTKTFGILADGLTVAAVVVGVVSLYYTVKWGRVLDESQPPPPGASAAPKGAHVSGPRLTPTSNGAAFTF